MSTPSWKIFVISLRRAMERRQQVLRQLLPLGLPFEIVDAVDARQTRPEFLSHASNAAVMPAGAVACYHSHLGVMDRITAYQLDYGLILEDDFLLQNSSMLTLGNLWEHLSPEADHIQLHGMRDYMSRDYAVAEVGERFNKLACTNLFTVGYVISRRLAEYVLERHRLPRMAIDHLFVSISKLGKFNFHEVSEKLIDPDWSQPSCIGDPPENAFGESSRRSRPGTFAPKVLCYSLALDLGEVKHYRQQTRMMVASLKRSGFRGDFKIIHNGDTRIFDHYHPEVEEIRIDAPETTAESYRLKFKVRDLFSLEGYDWVMFLDTDFIISSDLDAWFAGPEIIRYTTEPSFNINGPQFNGFLSDDEMANLKRDGINSGAFVIRADHFDQVMAKWEEIDSADSPRCKIGDQHAWNRLLLDTPLSNKVLSEPEVKYFYQHSHVIEMLKAPVLHFCGMDHGEKILAMQAKFISHFHTDGDGTLVRMLER